MKKFTIAETLLILLLLAIPFVYAAILYPTLPETIPTHFGIDGKANGFSSKNSIWLTTSILTLVGIGIFLLLSFIHKIDPKRKAGQSPALNRKIAFVVIVFLTGINLIIIHSTQSNLFEVNRFVLPFMGLFFAVLGNYMHSIKPNYFVGFRTPWTLESEDNWRKTHQLVSKLWLPGGLLISIGTFILPARYGFVFFIVVLLPMIFIPVIFSYRYYKKHQS